MNNLEIIRLKLLKLINSEELYMKTESYYNEEVEMPNGEKIFKRVSKGKKPVKYGKADWLKSEDINNGNSARVRVRLVINEMSKLIKSAKTIIKETNQKHKEKIKKRKGEN
jgi:leucyl-tRNA synthetase